eukprot:jgi/Mesvir1/23751/Mv25773-RA.5
MCSENSVGIECFTTETPGFLAILKQRYSDFIVNEVDLSGTVLRLTDLSSIPKAPDEPTDTFLLPKDFEGRLAADSTRPASGEQPGGATAPDGTGSCGGGTTVDTDASGADVAAVAETFGQLLASQGELSAEQAGHEASRLKEFLLALQGSPLGLSTGGPVEPLLLPAIANKLHRTAVHQFFKKLPFLHTDTVMAPPSSLSGPRDPPGASGARAPASSGAGFSQIRVRSKRLHGEARAGAARGAGDAQGDADRGGKRSKGESEWRSNQWPSDRPPFLQFLLFKENKDTHDAIGLLSKLSNVPMGSLAFAGTKDKRAVTTQAVTAFKVTSERMAALNHKLHGMKVGNFKYVPAGLGLGDLKGNRFTIVLRRLEVESEDIVAAAVTALKETGFINYYGLQRFGNYAVPTHRIGAALARGEWAAAIDLILQGKASDSPDIARAHELYKKGQVADALRSVPKFMVIERSMLTQLQKNKSDLVGALLSIPRTMRMMYLHAYQSYLWNAAASERVKLFGAKAVVVGDLVRVSALNGATDGGCDDISEDVDELADAEAGKDLHLATGTGAGDSRKRPRDAPADTQAGSHRRTSVAAVKVVTQEDLTAGTFKVEDVVLPLPGKSVRYPNHEVAAVYKRLARQGLLFASASRGLSLHHPEAAGCHLVPGTLFPPGGEAVPYRLRHPAGGAEEGQGSKQGPAGADGCNRKDRRGRAGCCAYWRHRDGCSRWRGARGGWGKCQRGGGSVGRPSFVGCSRRGGRWWCWLQPTGERQLSTWGHDGAGDRVHVAHLLLRDDGAEGADEAVLADICA